MPSLWDDVKSAIVEGYMHASDKAEELTVIGKAKIEILRLNRQIANTMSEIGGRTFDFFEKGEQEAVPTDEEIRGNVEQIQALRLDIEKWEKEIEEAKAEREAKASVKDGPVE
jgi:hypothetical protein